MADSDLRGVCVLEPRFVEQDGAEPSLATCHDGAFTRIPADHLFTAQQLREVGLDVGAQQCCGEEDPRLPLARVELGRDDVGAAREPLWLPEQCAATAGEQEAPVPARGTDAIGIGRGEQQALTARAGRCCVGGAQLAAPGGRQLARPGERAAVDIAPRRRLAAAMQQVDPQRDVRILHTTRTAQQVALREYCGEVAGQPCRAEAFPCEQHVRQPGMRPEPVHDPSLGGDAARGVECTEAGQQVAGLGEIGGGRWVEECEVGRVGDTPGSEVESQRGEVRVRDLRRRGRLQAAGLVLRPQPVAHARCSATGAAAPLVGRGARDARGHQSAHPRHRIEAGAACKAGVDHYPHALDGQRCLGNRRREHDLAPSRGGRRQRGILCRGGQVAEQGVHRHAARQRLLLQLPLHAPDLGCAGQEHEEVALVGAERRAHGSRRCSGERPGLRPREVARLDGKGAALAGQHRRAAEQCGDRGGVERRRHHEQTQVLAQRGACVEAERKAEVGIQAALVEFVEDDEPDALQRRVGLQHAGQDAFRQHRQLRRCGDLGVQARAIADLPADRLAKHGGHAHRNGAGGETPRL